MRETTCDFFDIAGPVTLPVQVAFCLRHEAGQAIRVGRYNSYPGIWAALTAMVGHKNVANGSPHKKKPTIMKLPPMLFAGLILAAGLSGNPALENDSRNKDIAIVSATDGPATF